MFTDANTTVTKTPIDYIAEGYWQDFLTGHSIAGGIAYQAQLQTCQLDESLESLQRVDTLISKIRRDITKSVELEEAKLLTDEPYRNLLLFLAFYAGRVLAKQWGYMPHWYGQFELNKRYPQLQLTGDDFYQHMAVVYNDPTHHSLFFALEPIGLRLFGNIDRQFVAAQGGQVASGLYQAVSARLPNEIALNSDSVSTPLVSSQSTTTIAKNQALESQGSKDAVNTNSIDENPITTISINDVASIENNTTRLPTVAQVSLKKQSVVQEKVDLPDNSVSTTPVIIEPVAIAKSANLPIIISPTPEMFTQLLIELDEIEVIQTSGGSEYSQACKILDQFERHIAKQNKPRENVTFSESHQRQRHQALSTLQNAAQEGNTAAMLRLAMYELLNEGLITDQQASEEAGVEWVKRAADAQDSRAQRLLSKLYYQGLGVVQNIDNGRYWLEESAKNGHVEASTVVAQWQQAQTLMMTQKQEQHSFKRYQLLIGAITVAAILLIVLV